MTLVQMAVAQEASGEGHVERSGDLEFGEALVSKVMADMAEEVSAAGFS